jgi:hypothetical protein
MRAVTTPALKVVALHQSAHCRCAHHDATLVANPITELLKGAGWITFYEHSQIVSIDLFLQRGRLLGKILAYLKGNLFYLIVLRMVIPPAPQGKRLAWPQPTPPSPAHCS